jgi:hypothetical protein
MRAIVMPNATAARATQNRHRNGQGIPRCERLAGNARNSDGSSLVPCRCTVSTSPHATCPYATRDLGEVVELLSGQFAYVIHDESPGRLNGLNGADNAALATVADNQRKPAPAPT